MSLKMATLIFSPNDTEQAKLNSAFCRRSSNVLYVICKALLESFKITRKMCIEETLGINYLENVFSFLRFPVPIPTRVLLEKAYLDDFFTFETLKHCEFSFVIGSLSIKFPYLENIFYGAKPQTVLFEGLAFPPWQKFFSRCGDEL